MSWERDFQQLQAETRVVQEQIETSARNAKDEVLADLLHSGTTSRLHLHEVGLRLRPELEAVLLSHAAVIRTQHPPHDADPLPHALLPIGSALAAVVLPASVKLPDALAQRVTRWAQLAAGEPLKTGGRGMYIIWARSVLMSLVDPEPGFLSLRRKLDGLELAPELAEGDPTEINRVRSIVTQGSAVVRRESPEEYDRLRRLAGPLHMHFDVELVEEQDEK